MKIQTLSIEVPTNGCVNNCLFCVSRTHENNYSSFHLGPVVEFEKNSKEEYFYKSMVKRLKYAKDNDVHTIILTGTGEPLQNQKFLEFFAGVLKTMDDPFPNIELQTTGVMLDDTILNYLKKEISVSTISLSVNNIFDDNRNLFLMGVNEKLKFNLKDLCLKIKDNNLNLRLSLNMTSDYDFKYPVDFFKRAKELNTDQITFRELYSSNNNTKQDKWIKENAAIPTVLSDIKQYITENGRPLYVLPFGYIVYSVDGIGTLVDSDCMNSKQVSENLKYLILRKNNKLYSHWDDPGSLIF
jgi:sulfatase maturation enzyme AslB (radical SAM superfamily)